MVKTPMYIVQLSKNITNFFGANHCRMVKCSLRDDKAGAYLYHKSELGQFFLGSDAITHSYRHHKRKQWLTRQIPEAVNRVFSAGSTIGAYIIFPNNIINNKQTINGARGCNGKIDDSFDLTFECIRRFYLGLSSPLHTRCVLAIPRLFWSI